MRSTLRLVSGLLLLVPTLIHSQSPIACLEPKAGQPSVELLIVTGGHSYEADEFFAAFDSMPNVHYRHVGLIDGALDSTSAMGLTKYDVILLYDLEPGVMTRDWRGLLDHGGGLFFLHHAIGSFSRSSEITTIIGGHANFAADTIAGVSNATVHANKMQHFTVTDSAHPITCGIRDFDMLDEAYGNVGVDSAAHILLTSDTPTPATPVGWTWSFDKKRVLYVQPGHGTLWLPVYQPSSYQNATFLRLLNRGIMWAAGRL